MTKEADGFDPGKCEPLGGVWSVFIHADTGEVIGPGVDLDDPRPLIHGYASRIDGKWERIPDGLALEMRQRAEAPAS